MTPYTDEQIENLRLYCWNHYLWRLRNPFSIGAPPIEKMAEWALSEVEQGNEIQLTISDDGCRILCIGSADRSIREFPPHRGFVVPLVKTILLIAEKSLPAPDENGIRRFPWTEFSAKYPSINRRWKIFRPRGRWKIKSDDTSRELFVAKV